MPHTDDDRYQLTLDYLYRFVDFSLSRNFTYSPESFNLARMRDLLARLEDPHHYSPVIHVAGTKGKGSTAAMIAAVLRENGFRTGLYTSPHLEEFCERIQVDGVSIPPSSLVRLVEQLKPVVEGMPEPVTFFEWTTALAFVWFRECQCQMMVIETGLGGRLDSTNVVDPLVSVITPISYDHMAVLGNTLTEIAGEKAGIIKPGRPVVSAPQTDEAAAVIRRRSAETGSPLVEVADEVDWQVNRRTLHGQDIRFRWKDGAPGEMRVRLPLLGDHQALNAATALTALRTARDHGVKLSQTALLRGLRHVIWPGRFETLQTNPLLIIDSAHNPDSAAKLRQTVETYLPGEPVFLVFGASADKDIPGIYDNLLPCVKRVYATQSTHPRAAIAGDLAALAESKGVEATPRLPLEDALAAALADAAKEKAVVLATGSLFIAGAVRSVWGKLHKGADGV